ncbi:anthranilate synthase component I [Aureliella helgolandensis]|uniref:Anthranilate synthase component 1 n=1 Tax=Aureliella helgolandensis TaxID=2527968 RepID=A0A518G0Q2_9BACT|nr:anthranilate synthase component I [Aureliella helgolandensis]QDV22179.1 Anthranilate synthase component 1 [Aureliella helgolandensis]
MLVSPVLERFAQLAQNHELVPVYRQLLSDALTPVSAFSLLDDGESAACLFESVIGGEKVGRYSFIAVRPRGRIFAHGLEVTTNFGGQEKTETVADPLDSLWDTVAGKRIADLPELPPLSGGAIGYAGYDVVRYVEHLPNAPEDDRGLPDIDFSIFDDLVIFDHVTKSLFVVAIMHCDEFDSAEAAYAAGSQRLQELTEQLQQPHRGLTATDFCTGESEPLQPISNFTQAEFEAAVEKCTEYIRAGDIFQVVISQRMELPNLCEPFEVYRSLRVVNPSPFMFYVRTPAVTLVGASPEVMCRVVGGVMTVRPLAGTRKRGKTAREDTELAAELLADPKERAEHVMLVDLGRNDVGRVAKYGTVELSDVMTVEHYSHVMHISSNVQGELREGLTAMDGLKASLPAGTVSGAPKVRAMEVIDEIEPHRRGPYAGAVGYIDYSGDMDTCIALRTLVFSGDKIYVQAGAGIVADSIPSEEFQETLNKAGAMLKAIETTVARTGKSNTAHS